MVDQFSFVGPRFIIARKGGNVEQIDKLLQLQSLAKSGTAVEATELDNDGASLIRTGRSGKLIIFNGFNLQ